MLPARRVVTFKCSGTDSEYEGTGIGLAVVKRAVRMLGGELKIESAVGEGSTFVVILPASMVEDGDPDNPT